MAGYIAIKVQLHLRNWAPGVEKGAAHELKPSLSLPVYGFGIPFGLRYFPSTSRPLRLAYTHFIPQAYLGLPSDPDREPPNASDDVRPTASCWLAIESGTGRSCTLPTERKWAADQRAYLKTLEPGDETLEAVCAHTREHCRHYRVNNQKTLALKQRKARKKAFIEKHGAQEHARRARAAFHESVMDGTFVWKSLSSI
ncbi:hypothetical protein B0H14DRAFT_3426052 [Mycena olivaceomarginata]|nr:hypothetical protein B0H14DRAFT_3426052 [Mycena olivaceomarginata]